MRRLSFNIIAVCVIGSSLLSVGCGSNELIPMSSSTYSLLGAHDAIADKDSIKIKISGTRLSSTSSIIIFNFFVENAGKNEVRVCTECMTVNSLEKGALKPYSVIFSPDKRDDKYFIMEEKSFVIPSGSVMQFSGQSLLRSPIPKSIRVEIDLNRVQGKSSTFSFNFEIPGQKR